MGLNLISDSGEEYRINSQGWSYLLELASRHGWQEEDSFDAEEGRFSAAEVALLADALEKALNDAAPNEHLQDAQLERDLQEAGFISPRFNLASWLNDNRSALKEFIKFAGKGGFVIQ
jgi:hypothetical protein